MRIERLHIYGYGKWEDLNLRLSDFTVMYGENEAGKSTIRSFIKSILFGPPQKGELHYEPKAGGRYGGALTISTEEHGTARIERIFKGDVTIFFADGTRGGEAELKRLLHGMDAHVFDAVFSFDMHGLQHIYKINRDQLGAYLFSAGAMGTDILPSVQRLLQRRMDELFRPNGRKPVVNAALRELGRMRTELERKQAALEQYNHWLERQREAENALLALREQRAQLQERETLQLLQPLLIEKRGCEAAIQAAPKQPVPAALLHRRKELREELQALTIRQGLLQEQIAHAEKEMADLPASLAPSAAGLIEECREQQPFYETARQELQQALSERRRLTAEIQELCRHIGWGEEPEMPTVHAAQKEELKRHVLAAERLREMKSRLDDRFAIAKELLEEREAEVRNLQDQLPPRRENHKDLAAEKKGQHLLLLLLMGVLLLGAGVWLHITWLFAGALGLSAGAALLYGWAIYRRRPEEDGAGVGLRPLIERERERLQLAEQAYERIVLQYEEWEREQYEVQQFLIHFRKRHGLADSFPHTVLLSVWEDLEDLVQLRRLREKAEERISRLTQQLRAFEQKLGRLREQLPLPQETWTLQTALAQLQESRRQEGKRQQLDEVQREWKRELENTAALICQLEREQQQLWAEAGVADDEDLERTVGQYERSVEMRGRLLSVEQQIAGLQKRLTIAPAAVPEEHEAYADIQQALSSLQKQEEQLQKEAAEARARLLQLEGEHSYRDLLHEQEQHRSQLRQQAKRWAVYAAAKSMLAKAKEHYHTLRLPQVLIRAEEYFMYMTGGEYVRLFVPEKEHTFLVERHDGMRFDSRELSQATAEQLYAALRLALASAFEHSFPLIIDDSFVHFDRRRAELTAGLLRRIAAERQIIFFTCHEHMRDWFEEQLVHDLNEAAK